MSLPILDVAIGVSFIYLLLALICTTVNEMLAGWMKTRARFLDRGIARLLGNDDALKRALYAHPLIQSLSSSDAAGCPSYIPSSKFATALMDILSGPGRSLTDVAAVRQGVEAGSDQLKTAVTALLDHAGSDPAAVRAAIEQWFDEGMDRVSGWYKRHAQTYALILACAITLVLNADTVQITKMLWVSPTVRAAVVEEAKVRSQKARPEELLPMVEYPNPQDATASEPVNVPEQALSDKEQALLGQLTGWSEDWQKFNGSGVQALAAWLGTVIWLHGLGWILTAVAVSLGAPFWFDTLNRFMNIRNAGRAPNERKDKSRPATS
jgi:hypothetical protein